MQAVFTGSGFDLDIKKIRRYLRANYKSGLHKIGAYLRRRARTSLRRRKRVSQPGERPSVHSTDDTVSLKHIAFVVAPDDTQVLCGPIRLNQRNMVVDVGSQTVPQILEFGGTVRIHEEARKDGRPWAGDVVWGRRDMRRGAKPWKKYRVRNARYQPRPFMGPALEAEIRAGTIPQSLSGTVRAI